MTIFTEVLLFIRVSNPAGARAPPDAKKTRAKLLVLHIKVCQDRGGHDIFQKKVLKMF